MQRDLFGEPLWQPPETAPRGARDFWAECDDGELRIAHYACDLSGEEQPPFQGFFAWNGLSYHEVTVTRWVPARD